jgi:hypothetical protein
MIEESKYIIFQVNEVNKINFNEVNETDVDSLRLSVDGTKTFVNYNNEMPLSVASLETKSIEYTYNEVIDILSTEEWVRPLTP